MAYEPQKKIGLHVVDFYLPAYNACIDYNGLSHFYGSTGIYLCRHYIKKQLIEKEGYKYVTISSHNWAHTSEEQQMRIIKSLLR